MTSRGLPLPSRHAPKHSMSPVVLPQERREEIRSATRRALAPSWRNMDMGPSDAELDAREQRPVALVLTGDVHCGLCLRPIDFGSVCEDCGAAYHLDGEWR